MRRFDFHEINLVPKKCIVASRNMCDTRASLGPYTFKLPVVPANMECVVNYSVAHKLAKHDYFYIYHRFHNDTVSFSEKMKRDGLPVSISIGVNKESEDILDQLLKKGIVPDYITIDIAHGHSESMKNTLEFLLKKYKECDKCPFIIAGNVCTPEAVQDLESWGADAIKLGVGPGCFTSDTRVLMANGIYKNINEIQIGDYVINQNGKPVLVKNVMNMGLRDCIKIKNNLHYKNTFVTPDHNFFIGDLSSTNINTIKTRGIAKILDKKSKTVPKQSKYKWKEVGKCEWDKTFALFPKEIDWQLPENFKIDMADYVVKNKSDNENYIQTVGGKTVNKINRYIESNYDLGYIFGTFLGDGCSSVNITPTEKKNETNYSYQSYIL